ncbi:hypothetical protein [Candidatus Coxiella mudrowiae]|uniref:hypothetical protein n=1 Tax=Candidatus Coxiella mudrowiae TaxID=2054173 RepID=UPI0012FEE80D|nr:hypothetical protein [Candidatus Coxiella mudrowiae]
MGESRAFIILVNAVVMIAHPKRVQEQAKPKKRGMSNLQLKGLPLILSALL